MRILYVSHGDPRNPALWSGTARWIWRSLERLGHEVQIHTLPHPWLVRKVGGVIDKLTYYSSHKHIHGECHPAIQKIWSWGMKKTIARDDFDLIFGWHPFHLAPVIHTRRPRVFWYDTTFSRTVDLYYPNITPEAAAQGRALEKMVIERSTAAIYPSEWAAGAAVADYHIDPAKAHVISFGANMETEPSDEACDRAIEQRLARPPQDIQLLFVGMDWPRKGGETALGAVRQLRQSGWNATLAIVGCDPPLSDADNQFVRRIGFIDKKSPGGLEKLSQLYLESDFFIMTSRAESYGIVYCEALAHACPCLATQTGGVGTIVIDGQSGAIFPWNDQIIPNIAAKVEALKSDPQAYRALCQSSRNLYKQRFNWNAATQSLGNVLDAVVNQGGRP